MAVPVNCPMARCGWKSGSAAASTRLAQVRAHPEATLIACEVFENGICSLLSALVPEARKRTRLPRNLRFGPMMRGYC